MKTAHDVSAHNVPVHTAAVHHDAACDGSVHEAALDAACLCEIARVHTTPTYISVSYTHLTLPTTERV